MGLTELVWDYAVLSLDFLWSYVVPFLFILTILVFVHEMGHYLVARRNRVRVEVFSIGFGPEIHGWTDSVDTRWKIGAIPLGGYVKMFGMSDEMEDGEEQRPPTPEEKAVSFQHKRLGQRSAIIVAGPIANFVFAIVLLAGMFSIVGSPEPLSGIGTVQEQSAAAEAGMRPGDRILNIGGEEIALFTDLQRIVRDSAGVPLSFVILRGGEEIALMATPRPREVEDDQGVVVIGLLGVTPDPDQIRYQRHDPLTAVWMATERSFGLVVEILSYLGDMISGTRDAEELGGPIRIAQMSGEMAQGGLVNLIFFMAALSINLGMINLFPIPILDGGHLFFNLVEAIRGRPLGPRIQEYGFRIGLILLLLLMIFATWNDLVRL